MVRLAGVHARIATVVVVLAAVTVACAQTPSSQPALLAEKDIAHWVLPFDAYQLPAWGYERYAIEIITAPCMAEAGFRLQPAVFSPDRPSSATSNSARRRLFDESIARIFGYRGAPDPQWDVATARKTNAETTAGFVDAYVQCSSVAYDVLGFPDRPDWTDLTGLGYSPEADPAVEEARVRWRECMLPLGIPDLPGEPNGMPSPTLAEKWGFNEPMSADLVDPGELPPVAEEIEVAVHDAKCRDSSGWANAYYEAEWALQEQYVLDHFDDFERQRARNDELLARIREVVAGQVTSSQ